MCLTCGCGNNDDVRVLTLDAHDHSHHDHHHDDHEHHDHEHHDHEHHDHEHHDHDHSHQLADAVQRPTPSTENLIIGEAILAKNDHLAQHNRDWFAERSITALNLMSSPGSGKTSLLERTIAEFGGDASRVRHRRRPGNDLRRQSAFGGPAPVPFR